MLNKYKTLAVGLIFGLTLAGPAVADLAVASGAGQLPATAEDLTDDSQLSEIVGALDFPYGVDVFAIDITVPQGFAAYTVPLPFGVPDPELFLFDSSGRGVYMNDDETASDTQACLPSQWENPCPTPFNGTGPTTPGVHYLAITRSAQMPLDMFGNDIFSPALSTDVVGPSSSSPVVGWDGGVYTSPDFDLVNYDIVLQDVPEPNFLGVTGLGLAGLLLFRRARCLI